MKLKLWASIFLLFLAGAVVLSDAAPKKRRTQATARRDRASTQQRIDNANRQISANAAQTERTLAELQLIHGEIDAKEREIAIARTQVDSLNSVILSATDSITSLNADLTAIQRSYVNALRRFQGSQYSTNILAYIFSSRTFYTAYSRLRYLREFADWRKRRVAEINRIRNEIETQRNLLASLQTERTAVLGALNSDQAILVARRNDTGRLVTRLQSDGRSLQAALAKEKQRLAAIDAEITRMINEDNQPPKPKKKQQPPKTQPRKPQKPNTPAPPKKSGGRPTAPSTPDIALNTADPDADMTARFTRAKGTMTFPVPSPYRIVNPYGASSGHRFNTGIEVVCDGTPTARAIFDGTVSRIFENKKNTGVYTLMVRHGAYISVYYNIKSPSVKAGTKVTAGQPIGTISVDSRLGKPMLHFEIRKDSQTLDPTSWLR